MCMRRLLAFVLCTTGCKSLLYNDPVVASVQSRIQGGCYSQCSPGWRCNPKTGYCEQIPPTPAREFPVTPTQPPDGGT
jgi:hypothetical protein